MRKYEVNIYRTESGNCPVEKYIEDMVKKKQEKDLLQIKTYIDRLSEYGMSINNVFPQSIRKLEGDIYELRPDNHRIVFFYFDGNTFVLLHAFKKQHGKAPPHEIRKAQQEMKDYIRRNQK